jgi:hypothetical protein
MLKTKGYLEVIVFRKRGYIRTNCYWYATEAEAKAAKRKTQRDMKEFDWKVELLFHQVRPCWEEVPGEDPDAYSCWTIDTWASRLRRGEAEDPTDIKVRRMLAVPCPKCPAKADVWCSRPDGRHHTTLHVARWRAVGGK